MRTGKQRYLRLLGTLMLTGTLTGLLSACGGSGGAGGAASKEVAQDSICVYANDKDAAKCKEGQLAWFKPGSWGNEQLPLLVVASYCDTNHQVLMNNAGVICAFTSKRHTAKEATPDAKPVDK
jgi:hypothetical protein